MTTQARGTVGDLTFSIAESAFPSSRKATDVFLGVFVNLKKGKNAREKYTGWWWRILSTRRIIRAGASGGGASVSVTIRSAVCLKNQVYVPDFLIFLILIKL